MHLSKVSIVNYRNFSNVKFVLSKGINTIIGENGSGKTNFFRSIRLLLDGSMRRSSMRLEERDFFRGLGNWRGHWIIISLEFDDVSQDEAIKLFFCMVLEILMTDIRLLIDQPTTLYSDPIQ